MDNPFVAMMVAGLFGILSGVILTAVAINRIVALVEKFKSGALVFQSPVRTNKADFSEWEFIQKFDAKTGKSELAITVATNRGKVVLPTLLVSDWTNFFATLPGAKKSQNGKTGTNGQNQSSKKAKKNKSQNSGFLGKGKTISQNGNVLIIKPSQDLYPNMRIKLSDNTEAQIVGIQVNGKSVSKANTGQHVGIELDVNAIAGAVHKA